MTSLKQEFVFHLVNIYSIQISLVGSMKSYLTNFDLAFISNKVFFLTTAELISKFNFFVTAAE